MANVFMGSASTGPYNPSSAWYKNPTNPLGAQGPYSGGSVNNTGIPIKLAPFPTQQTAVAPAPWSPYNIAPTPASQQADVMPSTKSPYQTGFGGAGAVMPNPPPSNAPFDFSSLPNIQAYMNPYLDQIIQHGTNAIMNSAAGKGHALDGTWDVQQIGDWATNATSQAYQQAFDNFNTDRNFGANRSDEDWKRYAQERGLDANDYQFEQNYRTGNYYKGKDAYDKLMSNRQGNLAALAEGGPKMAQLAADLAIALGVSEANIYTALAQMKAEGYVGQANAQGNLLGQAGGILEMFL